MEDENERSNKIQEFIAQAENHPLPAVMSKRAFPEGVRHPPLHQYPVQIDVGCCLTSLLLRQPPSKEKGYLVGFVSGSLTCCSEGLKRSPRLIRPAIPTKQ